MKKGILLLGIFSIFVFVIACVPPAQQQPEGASGQETEAQEGRVVFTIADAAADMGAVSSVVVTIDSISAHSSTEGWVTVSSTPQNVDLLMLKAEGSQRLLADVQLKEGTYEQLRLSISEVLVTDDEGEHQAKLPSEELKIVTVFEVAADSTSTAKFDFIVDESLHVTGNGEYILAPVVQLETREAADVEIKADKKVEIRGGNVKANLKVGMDEEGKVGVGLGIPARVNISISQGKIRVGRGIGADVGVGIGARSDSQNSDQADADAEADAQAGMEVGVGVY